MRLAQAGDGRRVETAFAADARQADFRHFAARQVHGDQQLLHALGPAMRAIAKLLVLMAADIEAAIEVGAEILVGRQVPDQVDARRQAGEIGVVERIEQVGAGDEELHRPLGLGAGERVEHVARPAVLAMHHRERQMEPCDRADGRQQRRHAVRLVVAVERMGEGLYPAGGFGHGSICKIPEGKRLLIPLYANRPHATSLPTAASVRSISSAEL